MNRLVERAAAPTIWIINDVNRLGPAIIRRMTLALRFSKPKFSVRKTMVTRIANSADFQLNETALVELARTPAPPALIENAILCAARIRGSAANAQEILGGSLRALESVRRVYAGLHSFLNMSLMEARRRKASDLLLRFSQSFASLRHRPSQAKVRSTTHRLGRTTKAFA